MSGGQAFKVERAFRGISAEEPRGQSDSKFCGSSAICLKEARAPQTRACDGLRSGSEQQEAAVNLCGEPSARHRTWAGGC